MSAPPGAGPARDLKQRLIARIKTEGPMTLAAYMAEALYDPTAGYYATKDPIGAAEVGGDFITAPEVSQMFGELVGLWCAHSFAELAGEVADQTKGEALPSQFDLIELGPGRGTLMADILRAMGATPLIRDRLAVSLVEASPALQAVQAHTLAQAPMAMTWLRETPAQGEAACLIIANEFLDCLPIRQFVRLNGDWRERMVGLDPQDDHTLAFVFAAPPAGPADIALMPPPLRFAPEGALVEIRPGITALLDRLTPRLKRHGGRALFIDYGPAHSEPSDTFQAVKAHQKISPLDAPGEADLTARVDFAALAEAARATGLDVAGPVEQGAWLRTLGLEQRAAALIAQHPEKKTAIAAQVNRLAGDEDMGVLFKVICLSSPGLPPPAGLA